MINMMNQSGPEAIQTNETKTAHNLLDSKQSCQLFFVSKTVL